jgi:hypothetical protein
MNESFHLKLGQQRAPRKFGELSTVEQDKIAIKFIRNRFDLTELAKLSMRHGYTVKLLRAIITENCTAEDNARRANNYYRNYASSMLAELMKANDDKRVSVLVSIRSNFN